MELSDLQYHTREVTTTHNNVDSLFKCSKMCNDVPLEPGTATCKAVEYSKASKECKFLKGTLGSDEKIQLPFVPAGQNEVVLRSREGEIFDAFQKKHL